MVCVITTVSPLFCNNFDDTSVSPERIALRLTLSHYCCYKDKNVLVNSKIVIKNVLFHNIVLVMKHVLTSFNS